MQSYLNVEYLFYVLFNFFNTGGEFAQPREFFTSEFYTTLIQLWNMLTIVATIVSLILLTLFIYSALRLAAIRKEEDEKVKGAIIVPDDPGVQPPTRWQRVETIFAQGGETNWRQAIIEADIMLDDMLTVQGYLGDTIGDKLKAVEPSDFTTLEYAWAAHKVRNNIAHQGQDFTLTEREAKQTLHWYERVFDEFHFN